MSHSPDTSLVLTIRLIKSFEFRAVKNLVLKDVAPSTTVAELKEIVKERTLPLLTSDIKTASAFKAVVNVAFDTMKLYVMAHGHKSQNLIINLDNEGYLDDTKTLQECGIENETEISFFKAADYERFKANPEIKWE
ncbi:hypothetical protein HDU91_002479 [Kappamyces sp. JEL0680]|nr:hypothetical protein HDU91_002479 [Kappamyces sp. JEL0680]